MFKLPRGGGLGEVCRARASARRFNAHAFAGRDRPVALVGVQFLLLARTWALVPVSPSSGRARRSPMSLDAALVSAMTWCARLSLPTTTAPAPGRAVGGDQGRAVVARLGQRHVPCRRSASFDALNGSPVRPRRGGHEQDLGCQGGYAHRGSFIAVGDCLGDDPGVSNIGRWPAPITSSPHTFLTHRPTRPAPAILRCDTSGKRLRREARVGGSHHAVLRRRRGWRLSHEGHGARRNWLWRRSGATVPYSRLA